MRPKLVILFYFAVVAWMVGCSPPPQAQPCAWNWANGDSSALDQSLQTDLDNAGIIGKIKTSSYGETGGNDCSYHEMGITAEVTVYVVDTTDQPALAALAEHIEEILQKSSASYNKPSLANGNSALIFKGATGSTAKECRWNFKDQACQ